MRNRKLEKIYLYSVVIEPCEEGGYFASCPSLQGCHAEGETYAKVMKNIEDVIKQHIKVRKEHDEFVSAVTIKKREMVNVNLPVLIKA